MPRIKNAKDNSEKSELIKPRMNLGRRNEKILLERNEEMRKLNSSERENNFEREDNKKKIFFIKFCNFLISFSLILIFAGIPLFFTGSSFQGIGFEKQMFFYIFVLLGFSGWIIKAMIEGEITIKRTLLDIPILIFLIVLLISSIFSVNRCASFLGSFGVPFKSFLGACLIALFYWFLIANINLRRLKNIFLSLLISFGIVSLISILNLLSVNFIGSIFSIFLGNTDYWRKIFVENSGFNTVGLLSNFAIFICSAILLTIGIIGSKINFFRSERKIGDESVENEGGSPIIRNVLFALLLLFLVFVLLALGKYISLLALLIGLGLLLIFSMAGFIEVDKRIFNLISVLFIFVFLLMLSGRPLVQLKNLPSEAGLSNSLSWDITKAAFKEKYLLGFGAGNFEYAFSKYKPASFNNNYLWNIHFREATGIFYESLSTIGVLGTLAFILLILTFLFIVIKIILGKDTRADQSLKFLLVSLFVAVISLGINLQLYLSEGVILIFTLLMVALTLSVASLVNNKYFKDVVLSYNVKQKYSLVFSFLSVCFGCLIILLFIFLCRMSLADSYVNEALAANTIEKALFKMEKAVKFFPYQPIYYAKFGDIMALAGNNELENKTGDLNEKARDLFTNALASHKRAVEIDPNGSATWEDYGVFLESMFQSEEGILKEAENAYNKAVQYNPNNPALMVRIALLKERNGDLMSKEEQSEDRNKFYKEALENFKKGTQLKPDLVAAYDGASKLSEKMGNIDEAINYMTISFNLSGNNHFYPFNLGRLYYNRWSIRNKKVVKNELKPEGKKEEVKISDDSQNINGNSENKKDEKQGENSASQNPQKEDLEKKEGDDNNDLKISEALFKRAIELKPNYVDALFSLGVIYENLNSKSLAKDYYEKALKVLSKDDVEAKKVIEEKLKSL